eukprot:Skav214356  [mRNA]  locus=scaffold86:498779:503145:+ [translate_table: standard]
MPDQFGETLPEERRHGYLFPFPGGVVQSERSLVRDSLNALNRLAGSKFNDASQLFHRPATVVQTAAIDNVRRMVAETGECPKDLDGRSAIQDMMKSHPLYGEPSTLASFSPEKLKILKSTSQPKPLKSLVPPSVVPLLNRWKSHIELTPKEVDQKLQDDPTCCPKQPYWDPILKHSKSIRTQLLLDLWKVGVIDFRTNVKAHVGLFFVRKNDPAFIRMVVDCRIAHAHHRSPPVTRLGGGANFCGFDLSSEMLGEHFPDDASHIGYGSEMDVSDCFYQFSLPECAKWFGINDPRHVADWNSCGFDLQSVWDEDQGKLLQVSSSTIVYPVVNAMPMGWTWALFFANETVAHIAASSDPQHSPEIREKLKVPQLWEAKTLSSVYVDNVAIFGAKYTDVEERIQSLSNAFGQKGIPVTWTYSQPVSEIETVGVIVDFKQKVVRNKPARLWKIYLAGRELCRRSKLRATVEPKFIQEAISIKEKWRFIAMPDEVKSAVEFFSESQQACEVDVQEEHLRAFVRSGVGMDTEYGRWLQTALEEGSWLHTSPILSQFRAKKSRRIDIEIPELVKPVSTSILTPGSFRLLWKRRWRNTLETINIKEGRVCLSSLKRSARAASHVGTRKLTLCDNLSTVLALEKGRSSSLAMNRICKTACAIQAALQIRWFVRHVETKRNQADRPSRGLSMRRPPPTSLETPPTAMSASPSQPSSSKPAVRIHLQDVVPPPGLGHKVHESQCTCGSEKSHDVKPHGALDDHGHVKVHGTAKKKKKVKLKGCWELFCGCEALTKAMKFFATSGLKPLRKHWPMLRRSIRQSAVRSSTGSSSAKAVTQVIKKGKRSLSQAAAPASSNPSRLVSTPKLKLREEEESDKSRKRIRKRDLSIAAPKSVVPKHRELQCSKVKPKTLMVYQSAVNGFDAWNRQQRRSLRPHESTDEAISAYIHHLCREGKTLTEASYVVFGFILLRSKFHMPDKQQLPISRQALKGWRSRYPGNSRSGVDLTLWDLVAYHACLKGFFLAASAILIQGDCYLRPCETLALTRRHLIPPQRRMKSWGVIVGLTEDAIPSKSGEFDECVFADSPGRSDVNLVLSLLAKRRVGEHASLFSPLTPKRYNLHIQQAAEAAGLSFLHLTSHHLRHSGASHDAYYKTRTLKEIQTRGRWKAANSVNRYRKPGRMLLSQASVSRQIWKQAETARMKVVQSLSQNLQ